MNKVRNLFLLIALVGIFSILVVSAIGEPTFCCERTTKGAWCQDSPAVECNPSYRSAATSCESTSYCRPGTCVNSQEGTCLENTPQKICQDNNGVWFDQEPEQIPQCQLGCCIVGDQAAFVTQTRCESLAGLYGVESNFRTDIKTEAACIASASPTEKGACVIDDGLSRDCRLLSRAECQKLESGSSDLIEFHEGFLCSAESLGTICGMPENPQTTCLEDKDEVYFLDTCGNIANIYDSSKKGDQEYWTTIKDKAESCNPGSNNADSASCGNCDYLAGSVCKEYERGNKQTVKPNYGDFVCADLSCEYGGKTYEHGETWCGSSEGIEENAPGSESHRLVCYNGEVTIEQCSSFRQEICVEQEDDEDFSSAACKVNMWQDCVVQDNQNDCENADKRDCSWIVGESILTDGEGKALVVNENGELVPQGGGIKIPSGSFNFVEMGAACVPKYSPGFDFWTPSDDGGEAEELCILASQNCVVKVKNPIIGGWECEENCECIGLSEGDDVGVNKVTDWLNERNNLCVAIGDCGSKENYIGTQGYEAKDSVTLTKDIE